MGITKAFARGQSDVVQTVSPMRHLTGTMPQPYVTAAATWAIRSASSSGTTTKW
jgi:hypothetical protein